MEPYFNIYDLFKIAAEDHRHKTAIIYKDERVTFKVLVDSIQDTANYYQSKGIQKGDRVLVFVPMSIDLYRIVLALIKIGAVAVFIDEWVSKKRMNLCCKIADCKGFIAIKKAMFMSIFFKELRKIPIKIGVNYSKTNPAVVDTTTNKTDIALITFTTGSTGTPKAAKRSHELLYYQFTALSDKIPKSENEVCLVGLPIVLMINLASGITSLIADGKSSKAKSFNAEKILASIEKYFVTSIVSSPYFIKQLSNYLILKGHSRLQILKIVTGGAPVFPSEAATYKKAFPTTTIQIVYGSTEAEPISSVFSDQLLHTTQDHEQGLLVGDIDTKCEVRIIPIVEENLKFKDLTSFDKFCLEDNTIGEIIVKGDHVIKEYLNDTKAFSRNKIMVENTWWHRTGDSGYIKNSSQLFLTGRCQSIILVNNKTLYPFIFENHFLLIEGVEIGTVIIFNNAPTAVIELKNDCFKKAVLDELKETKNLLEYVIFLKLMPRDPRHNSKIDYANLKELCKKSHPIKL